MSSDSQLAQNRELRQLKALKKGRAPKMSQATDEFLRKAMSADAKREADEDSILLEEQARKEQHEVTSSPGYEHKTDARHDGEVSKGISESPSVVTKPVDGINLAVVVEPKAEGSVQTPPSGDDFAIKDNRELRIAMVGNVDSGKSTLVGVLSKGALDDGMLHAVLSQAVSRQNLLMLCSTCFISGRGSARSHVFSHKHEQVFGNRHRFGVTFLWSI
jgi:ATPase subunit of ABC transporter with duplicated ATPase domains